MYTIEEPYVNPAEPIKGNVPFFIIKNSLNEAIFFAVTRQECEAWIEKQNQQ